MQSEILPGNHVRKKYDSSQMFRMKLAVALACLAKKPPRMTGREFAQQLCDWFLARQIQWRERFQQATDEILTLKQKLILATHNATQPPETNMDPDEIGSQPLFPTPPGYEYQAAASCSSLATSSQPVKPDLSSNTLFLQSLIRLKTASRKVAGSRDVEQVTKQTILNSLVLLQEQIGNQCGVQKVQDECINCIFTFLHNADQQLKSEVVAKVTGIIDRLIEQVLSKATCISVEQRRRNSGMLVQLSAHKDLTQTVIDRLLGRAQSFTDELRKLSSTEQFIDPHDCCSMHYIVIALDSALENKTFLSPDFLQQLQTRLEHCLLNTTDSFPLVAHVLWKMQSKLQVKTDC